MKYYSKRLLAFTKWVGLLLLLVAVFLAAQYWLWLRKAHEVYPGTLYRSAQLSTAQLSQVVQEHKILSILNLRGENSAEPWYQKELKFAADKNLSYYHLGMQSYTMPSKAQLLQLVHILQTSPKPLLVHCEGGADRTGLASAIYLILQNKSLAEAEKEYSLHYYVINKSSVGKLVIPRYAAWLKKNNFTSSQQHFLNWLAQS